MTRAPNARDIGSARILARLGFATIATTSSGFAPFLGRMDQRVMLDEFVAHGRVPKSGPADGNS